MRAVIALLILAPGCSCSCGGDPDDPDGATDAGHDATALDGGRDAEPDAPSDGGRDASVARCGNDEQPVDLVPVDRTGAAIDCGPGCRQVTFSSVNAGVFDVKGRMLAYIGGDTELGFIDLDADGEFLVPVPEGHVLANNDGIAIDDGTLTFSTFSVEEGLGCLWRLDLARSCLVLLRSLDRLDETYGDIPNDLDLDVPWLVWFDQRWGPGRQDLFAYDLEAASERRLTTDQCCVGESSIWGTQIVYQGWADGPRGIHVLDLGGGEARRVWDDPQEQRQPAIWENRVVFTYVSRARDPFDEDIHGVDLDTGKDFVVAADEGLQAEPDVYGDLVVWTDCRNNPDPHACNSNIDVYARDLATSQEIQVTALPGLEGSPRIWERTVYFIGNIDGTLRVCAVDVP